MLKFIKQKKALVAFSLIISFIQVVISLWQPDLMAQITENLLKIGNTADASSVKEAVYTSAILVIGVGILGLIIGLVNTFIAAKISLFVGSELRQELFEKIQTFSYQQIEKFSTSHLIVCLTNDITQIQNFIMALFQLIFRIPLMFVGCIIFITISLPNYWWTTFLYLTIVIVLVGLIMKSLFPSFSRLQKNNEELNTIVKENVEGARVVKSFIQERRQEERFAKSVDEFTKTFSKIGMHFAILVPGVTIVANLIIVLVMYLLADNAIGNPEQVAQIVSFSQYIMILMFTVVNGGFMMQMVGRAMVSVKRINEIIDYDSKSPFGEEPIQQIDTIEFKNVSFHYSGNDKDIIKDASFTIKKGEKVGIVGMTGSGKSTLVQLLAQLIYPTAGEILINNQSQFKFNHKQLLDKIAIVLQKANLFSGTIKSNLLQGKADASEEELVSAAQIAQAKEFIDKKENGFAEEVYQKGANLSGGQKQRLSIARGIVKNPNLLILDDSTSALDAQSEKLVKEAIYKDLKEMAIVIVAQKISSVIETDKIIVLKNGVIDSVGSHEELLKTSKTYQDICASQRGADE